MAKQSRGSSGRFQATGASKARKARAGRLKARIDWFGTEAFLEIKLTMVQRVAIAGQLLRDKVVVSLAQPVKKITSGSGKTTVDPKTRSKPGQFPRADTTRLMKSISYSQKGTEARVGTNVDYGLIHEVGDRPFLSRSLKAIRAKLIRIMTQTIRSKK
jgi:phage gpG-like protein